MLIVKLDTTDLKCSLCSEEIDALEDFMVHLKNVHKKNIFLDIKNQMFPFKFHTDDTDKFKCCICFKEHKNFRTLCTHMNVHYKNYVCKICKAGFVNKHGLVCHMAVHKTEGEYSCTHCPKVFATQRKLKKHERATHKKSHYLNQCSQCNETFRNDAKKVKHLAVVHGLGSVNAQCLECPRSFSAVTSLATHMKNEHSKKAIKPCSNNGQKIDSKGYLQKHSLEHTGQQNFQCKICFKSYTKKSNLQEHMRSHEGKNFNCEQCGRRFVHKCNLKKHKCVQKSTCSQPKETKLKKDTETTECLQDTKCLQDTETNEYLQDTETIESLQDTINELLQPIKEKYLQVIKTSDLSSQAIKEEYLEESEDEL
ncbi:hypothetical protein NE865_15466 [Phthorimaea operculella]|nr:hypothetical protein NE865_15466 [Phthorimaea operculella]